MESILIVLWVKEQAKPIQRNGCHESLLLNRYFFYRSLNQKQSKWRKRTLLLLCLFEIESPINQPHCLPLKEVALMKFWEYYTWLYLIILYQCTMHPAMSIDILEVHKSKNSLCAHFILKSIHSFFRWCKTSKNLTWDQNFNFYAYLRGYCGKTEEGVWEGWNFCNFLSWDICKQKIKKSFFLSAALHGENIIRNNNIFSLLIFHF